MVFWFGLCPSICTFPSISLGSRDSVSISSYVPGTIKGRVEVFRQGPRICKFHLCISSSHSGTSVKKKNNDDHLSLEGTDFVRGKVPRRSLCKSLSDVVPLDNLSRDLSLSSLDLRSRSTRCLIVTGKGPGVKGIDILLTQPYLLPKRLFPRCLIQTHRHLRDCDVLLDDTHTHPREDTSRRSQDQSKSVPRT